MQTMHTKGVTMCTFTPVTENKVVRDNFYIMLSYYNFKIS